MQESRVGVYGEKSGDAKSIGKNKALFLFQLPLTSLVILCFSLTLHFDGKNSRPGRPPFFLCCKSLS